MWVVIIELTNEYLIHVIQELIEAVVLPITHKERFKALGIKPPKGTRSYFLLNLHHVCVFIFFMYLFSFWHVRLFSTHSGVLMYVSLIWARLFLYYIIVVTMSLTSFLVRV